MQRNLLLRLLCVTVICTIALRPSSASAQVTIYHDRITFLSFLLDHPVVLTDDLESYALGNIDTGDRRGDFLYSFDPNVTQPAIVPGGNGGQALGGSPFDVFVGGDSVTLTYQPASAHPPTRLEAFGADFLYAPAFGPIPADTYRVGLADGKAAGQFAGNLDGLDGSGGAFFLGIIADRGAAFTSVSLSSVQLDPNSLVPAYQVDNLIYATVPEPGALCLFAVGGVFLLIRLRRRT